MRRGDGASGSLKSPKSVLCLCVLGFGKKKQHKKCSWSSWSCPPSRFALIYASCKPSALGEVRVFPSPRASSKRSTLKKTKKQQQQTTPKDKNRTEATRQAERLPFGVCPFAARWLGVFPALFFHHFPPTTTAGAASVPLSPALRLLLPSGREPQR